MNGADDRNKGEKERRKNQSVLFFWRTNVLNFSKIFNLNTFICENVELLQHQFTEKSLKSEKNNKF